MHKWHVHAALGRGRPSSQVTDSIKLSLRQFQVSALRAAEGQPASSPQLNRLKRNSQTTQEILNLQRPPSATRPLRGNQPLNPSSRSSTPRSAPLDLRSQGVSRGHVPQAIGLPSGFRSALGSGNPRVREGNLRGGTAFRGAPRGRGRGELRGGRGRSGIRRDRDDRGLRKRGGRDGEPRGQAAEFEHTAQEKEYMTDKAEREKPVPTPFDPEELTPKGLVRGGPTIIVSPWGMSEIVEEKLNRLAPAGLKHDGVRRQDLAQKLLHGDFVRFKDDEEKEAVLEIAQNKANEIANKLSEQKAEVVESMYTGFDPVDEHMKLRMAESWLGGKYILEEKNSKNEVLSHLTMVTRKNGSYLPKNEVSLAAKVRSLLPVQSKLAARSTRPARA